MYVFAYLTCVFPKLPFKFCQNALWTHDEFFIFQNAPLIIDLPTGLNCLTHVFKACDLNICLHSLTKLNYLFLTPWQAITHIFISWFLWNMQRDLTERSPPSHCCLLPPGHLRWCTFHTHTWDLIFLACLTCFCWTEAADTMSTCSLSVFLTSSCVMFIRSCTIHTHALYKRYNVNLLGYHCIVLLYIETQPCLLINRLNHWTTSRANQTVLKNDSIWDLVKWQEMYLCHHLEVLFCLMDVENGSYFCLNHLWVLKITCLGKTDGTFLEQRCIVCHCNTPAALKWYFTF